MCCNGKKGKHFNCYWLLFRNHASSAYQWLFFFFFFMCFALYGTCHKASNTVRCLSLSFELKKKKKTALLCLKNVYITDDFAFDVPDRLTTCRNRPNSPKSLFAANSGRRDVWWERNADGVGLRTPRGSRYPFHTLYFDKPVLALLSM